jgi:hypothetical protein
MGLINQLITGGPPPVDQWPTGTDLLEVPTIYLVELPAFGVSTWIAHQNAA